MNECLSSFQIPHSAAFKHPRFDERRADERRVDAGVATEQQLVVQHLREPDDASLAGAVVDEAADADQTRRAGDADDMAVVPPNHGWQEGFNGLQLKESEGIHILRCQISDANNLKQSNLN